MHLWETTQIVNFQREDGSVHRICYFNFLKRSPNEILFIYK